MIITIAIIPMCRRLAVRMNIMDMPGDRKVHSRPIPRSGGLAMAIGAFIPVMFFAPVDRFLTALLLGSLVIVAFGVLDDIRGLPYWKKMAAQVGVALIMIFYGGVRIESLGALLPDDMILPGIISIPLTLVTIVGVINAINLSDGLDGLAGGICSLSFVCIAYLAYLSENTVIAVVAVAVVGGIIGFLRYNTYPATLFMGDAGSQFLGLLAVSLSLKLTQGNTPLSRLLPLIILGFPILDTLAVMSERVLKGVSPFLADKNHFHHKLIGLGLYQTEAVIVIYVLQTMLIVSAYIFRFHSEWLLLVVYMIFCVLIISLFYAAQRMAWRFKRFAFFDIGIKGRLKFLKERSVVIIYSFRTLQVLLPAVMLLTCVMASGIQGYFSLFSLCAVIALVFVQVYMKGRLDIVLRVVLYIMTPFVVYYSTVNGVEWIGVAGKKIYNLSFVIIALVTVLTLKYTRRRQGFRFSPTDLLIIIFTLLIPNIPGFAIVSSDIGFITAKIIVFFFSFDVLIGEMRGEFKWLLLASIVSLLVIGAKGFWEMQV